MLAELRAAGLTLTVDGQTLYVEPASVLTDAQRAAIRANKETLVRELLDESRAGCLIRCENCRYFLARSGSSPDGWCKRFLTETWARVPFECRSFRS